MIDADRHSVQERHRQLDGELRQAGVPSWRAEESICILVPRRNLETWVAHLQGLTANETDDFKAKVDSQDIRDAGRRFGQRVGDSVPAEPADALPSFERGVLEAKERLRGRG